MRQFLLYVSMAVFGLILLVSSAQATIIGSLAVGSSGDVTATLTTLKFDPGAVTAATSLAFSGCGGVLGSAGCLAGGEGVIINNDVPFGPAMPPSFDHFLKFSGSGVTHQDLDFDLTTVFPGSPNANCASISLFQSCSVYVGSPVVLTEFASGTVASLALGGLATDGTSTAKWLGSLSSTFPGISALGVQQFFCPSGTCTAADFANNNSLTTSYSGTFIARIVPTPEPSSIFLTGFGLLLLARLSRIVREKLPE